MIRRLIRRLTTRPIKRQLKLQMVFLFIAVSACFNFSAGGALTHLPTSSWRASAREQAQEKTAEQVYRNIQVLKGVPASQLQAVMALFTGALGVKCSYCHTNQFDKDERPAKQTARRMIQMVLDLNRVNFGGQETITCYACHRGQTKPDTIVALGKNPWLPPPPSVSKPEASMPSADQILERYLKAVGGREALLKLTTRISRGSRVGADGVLVPEEVYQKAPNKMLVITKYPDLLLRTALNGQRGWSSSGDEWRETVGEELVELEREAAFNKELALKELYASMNVVGKAIVNERETYLVEAKSRSGLIEKLYFDAQTGLLLRRYRETKTVLGPFPLETDYEDFQVVDGVKLPLTIRWAMPGRTWGRRIAEVKHNVAIADEEFNPPAAKR